MADDISVCIYWENSSGNLSAKDGTILYVNVTCSKGKQSVSMTSKYELTCVEYEDVNSTQEDTGTLVCNPTGNSIRSIEHWIWTFLERE